MKFITREGNRSRALHARSGITEIPGARRTFSFPGRKMKEGGKKACYSLLLALFFFFFSQISATRETRRRREKRAPPTPTRTRALTDLKARALQPVIITEQLQHPESQVRVYLHTTSALCPEKTNSKNMQSVEL